jgi:hypothetical protein
MPDDSRLPWETLERWRTIAFLVAGVWLFAFVTYNGLQVVTDIEQSSFINTLTTAPALIIGHLGLLGFYPGVSESVPRNSLGGAIVVILAAVCALVLLSGAIVQTVFLGGPPADGGPTTLMIIGFVSWLAMMVLTALAYLLFGVAILRADLHSPLVGIVLLGPAIVFAVNLLSPVAVGTSRPIWIVFIISAMQAGAHLAIGLVLLNGAVPTDRTEPARSAVEG